MNTPVETYEIPVTHNMLFAGAWSPDRKTVYGGGWGVVYASDATTGLPLWNSNISRWYISCLVATPDGHDLIAMTSHDPPEVFLLDAATGGVKQVWSDELVEFVPDTPQPALVPTGINQAVFLDRSRMLVAHAGAKLSVVETAPWSARPLKLSGVQGEPNDSVLLAASENAANLALAVRRNRRSNLADLYILDRASLSVIRTMMLGLGEISSLAWSPLSDALLIGAAGGNIARVDVSEENPVWIARSVTSAAVEHLLCLDWDSAHPRVVAVDRNGMTRWLDAGSGALCYEGQMFTVGLQAVTATPDAQSLLGVSLVQFLVRIDRTLDEKSSEARTSALLTSRRHTDMLWKVPSNLRPAAIAARAELSDADRTALAAFNERRGIAANAVNSRLLEVLMTPASILPPDFLVHEARSLVEKYPQVAKFVGTLGWSLLRAGEPEKARAVLTRCVELRGERKEPVPIETLIFLSIAEARMGDTDSAHGYLRQVEQRWDEQRAPEHVVRLLKQARNALEMH